MRTKLIKTAVLYKNYNYNKPLREWILHKEINTDKEDYEDRSIETLISLILDHFYSDIENIKFPKPLEGDFMSATITTKSNQETFNLSLGV